MFKVDVTYPLINKLRDSYPPETTLGEIFQDVGATYKWMTHYAAPFPYQLEFKEESDYVLFLMKFL